MTEEDPQDPESDLSPVTEKEIRGCSSDADCVVSCDSINSCCGQLCQCTNVYNREFLEKLTAYHEKTCGRPRNCPVASCAAPTRRYEGMCRKGMCTTRSVPL